MPPEYYKRFKVPDGHRIPLSTNARRIKRLQSYKAGENQRLRPQETAGRISFTRNRTIFSDGEHAVHLYKVVSGVVRLCNYMRDGRRQIAEFAFPDDYFGILPQADYCNTAEAVSNVIAMRYSHPSIASLDRRERGPISTKGSLDFSRRLIQLLSQRVCATQSHALLLGKKTAQERIATLFMTLFEELGGARGKPFLVRLSRRDMADYLGLTIETISREITQLRRMHFIDIPDRDHIVVNNLGALSSLATGGSSV